MKYGVKLIANLHMCYAILENDDLNDFDFLVEKGNHHDMCGNGFYKITFFDSNDQFFSINKNGWKVMPDVKVDYDWACIHTEAVFKDPNGIERTIRSGSLGGTYANRAISPIDSIRYLFYKINELSVFTDFSQYDMNAESIRVENIKLENIKLKNDISILKDEVIKLQKEIAKLEIIS